MVQIGNLKSNILVETHLFGSEPFNSMWLFAFQTSPEIEQSTIKALCQGRSYASSQKRRSDLPMMGLIK